MKAYYNETMEQVRQEVNGSMEPLTKTQVEANQKKYGMNELVEGKKKSIPVIFLEQFKDFLIIILSIPKISKHFHVFSKKISKFFKIRH